MLVSRFLVGKDGRTPWDRRTGRPCELEVVPFWEYVDYKRIRHGKHRQNQLETERSSGVWLGHCQQSNEVLIGTNHGVIRAFTVARKPEGERWNAEAIRDVKGTPQQPDPSRAGLQAPIRKHFDDEEEEQV